MTIVRRALRRSKLVVGDYRVLLPLYLRLTAEGPSRAISDETDLVVEGFQRSGTTFAAHAIQAAQPEPLVITNHVHNTAILRVAIDRQLPTLCVVRPADECLPSYVVWDPGIGPRTILWEWLHYHRRLVELAPRVTIATFAQVTQDLGRVVRRFNERWGTGLVEPPANDDFRATVEDRIRSSHGRAHPGRDISASVPIPDDGRRVQLDAWRLRVADDARLQPGLAEAAKIYSRLEAHTPPD